MPTPAAARLDDVRLAPQRWQSHHTKENVVTTRTLRLPASTPNRGTQNSLRARVRELQAQGVDILVRFDQYAFAHFENKAERRMSVTSYSGALTYGAAETWLDGFEAGLVYAGQVS